jgi:hypothetical protein
MSKFLTIVKAWGTAIFHTEEQKKLAESRMTICEACPSLQEVDVKSVTGSIVNNYFQCGACGCPIAAKIYTSPDVPKEQKCPHGKWEN